MRVTIRPDRLRAFGEAEDARFCLVTSPSLVGQLAIAEGGGYRETRIVTLTAGRSLSSVLREGLVAEPAHVLAICPGVLLESPPPELLGRRKLMAMPCGSTVVTSRMVEHFLAAVERADPAQQEAFAAAFFERVAAARHLELADRAAGTSAVFRHLDGSYVWNQQAGPIAWGEQQLCPAGELSVLPADVMGYDPGRRLDIEGSLCLSGVPIVHGGSASYLPADQERIYGALATMAGTGLVLHVAGGEIRSVTPRGPAAAPAARMLEALCTLDSRYAVLWEIGFGINRDVELFPGNSGMNEVHGGGNGVLHVGVGLTPFTQYAPIFLCPGSTVLTDGGEPVLGAPLGARRLRRRTGACPCIEQPPFQTDRSTTESRP